MVVLGRKLEVAEDVYEYDDEFGYVGEVVHVDTTVLGDLIDHKAKTGSDLFVCSNTCKYTENLLSIVLGEGCPACIEDGHNLAFDMAGNLVGEAFEYFEETIIYVDNFGNGGDEDFLVGYYGLDVIRVVLLYGFEKDEGGDGMRRGRKFGFGAHLLILLLVF